MLSAVRPALAAVIHYAGSNCVCPSRWRDDGSPAAGTFEGWPRSLKEFTLLDPCCGSGHFLVSAFNLLVPLRMPDAHLEVGDEMVHGDVSLDLGVPRMGVEPPSVPVTHTLPVTP